MLEDLLLDEASIAASGLVKSVKRVDTTGAEFEAARTELASLTGTPPLAALAIELRVLSIFSSQVCVAAHATAHRETLLRELTSCYRSRLIGQMQASLPNAKFVDARLAGYTSVWEQSGGSCEVSGSWSGCGIQFAAYCAGSLAIEDYRRCVSTARLGLQRLITGYGSTFMNLTTCRLLN
jgi:hypothetical protein